MDGREAMTFSGGSASYYIHREDAGGSVPGTPNSGFPPAPGFRTMSSSGIPAHSNVRGRAVGQAFSVDHPHGNYNHGVGISMPQGVPSTEPVTSKKRRGRPRKYGPDGRVSLKLSPTAGTANSTPGLDTLSPERCRGRPPGSGRKQQLANLGGWMNNSAGLAFAPHVITVGAGEDVVQKILSLSLQRPRALCILSGTGTASSVTLRQPACTSVSGTYEGRFEILCLSGSYLVSEEGGPRDRTGSLSASLSSPDGHVIGGAIAVLIAASPVQIVLCSFVYGSPKVKSEQVTTPKSKHGSENQEANKTATPASASATQSYTPSVSGVWHGSGSADM